MNNTNITNESCSQYDTTEFAAVAVVSASVALVSAVACSVVIAGIVLFKKYLFFTQRLILYLSIAAMVNSMAIMLRLQRVVYYQSEFESKVERDLCIASGMLEQITGWWQLMAVVCITCSVFVRVVLKRNPEKAEWLFFFAIFFLPLTFNWIPFIHSAYGNAGAWCWIRNEDSDCDYFEFGQYLRFILWYIPLYILLFILLVSYFIILGKIRSLDHKWQGRYDPEGEQQQKMMQGEVRPLLWYPVIYLVLNIFALTNRIQAAFFTDPVLALWFLQAVFSPMQGGFVSLAYALDSETIRRLGCRRTMLMCRRSPEVQEYAHEFNPGLSESLLSRGSSKSQQGSQKHKDTLLVTSD